MIRLDVVAARHQAAASSAMKRSKRCSASCGPGPGLRVVLDGAGARLGQPQALDGAVVEVEVGQLGGAEVGLPAHRAVAVDRALAARAEHGEAVVLARDLDAAGLEVLDRVVGAAVAEAQLVGLEADGAAEQLVAEADAEDRHAGRRARAARSTM